MVGQKETYWEFLLSPAYMNGSKIWMKPILPNSKVYKWAHWRNIPILKSLAGANTLETDDSWILL